MKLGMERVHENAGAKSADSGRRHSRTLRAPRSAANADLFLGKSCSRLARAPIPRKAQRMEADPEIRRLLQAIRQHIDALPQSERLNGLLKFVAVMLNYLTREQVLNIRAEMLQAFGEDELAEALNLLDGHLALRDLQQEN
jgi:hypothetical protein